MLRHLCTSRCLTDSGRTLPSQRETGEAAGMTVVGHPLVESSPRADAGTHQLTHSRPRQQGSCGVFFCACLNGKHGRKKATWVDFRPLDEYHTSRRSHCHENRCDCSSVHPAIGPQAVARSERARFSCSAILTLAGRLAGLCSAGNSVIKFVLHCDPASESCARSEAVKKPAAGR